jgi:uncharacterized protein
VRTYLEGDLQALSSIAALPDFRRLMRAACLRLGQFVNQTELGRDLGLVQPTVHRYLNLLETSYLLLVRLPTYAVNRTKRLMKSPKLYWGDVGLALHLAGSPEPTGAHLENLVWRSVGVGDCLGKATENGNRTARGSEQCAPPCPVGVGSPGANAIILRA